MILINLLPHREEKRRRRKAAFFTGLMLSAAAGALVTGVWYSVLQQLKATQEARNAFLAAEIKVLDNQIKDIANLRAEIDALRARQRAVEDLQTDRNVPVYLLNELVRQTPDGLYLTAIKQKDGVVEVTGMALSNERVSEFLRNTLYNSPWLDKPELGEIKAVIHAPDKKEQRRLFQFSMKVSLKRPQAPAPASPAASAPVAAKS